MVYYMRHGQSEANVKGLFAGQYNNSPLTEKGKEQAASAAAYLKKNNISIDRIITSPLDRTKNTAQIVAGELGLPPELITQDDRLIEYDMGSFTGTPIRPISSQEITEHPETEDPHAFRKRVMTAVDEAEAMPGAALIVSHDGVGRMLEATRQGLDPMHFYDIPQPQNGRVVKLSLS